MAVIANGVGIGAVIRNAAGEVMAALSARGAAVNYSEEVGAVACRTALEFAIDAGFLELIIEGDSVTVMSAVSSSSPNWSRLSVIYDDVRCLVAGLCHVVFSSRKIIVYFWSIINAYSLLSHKWWVSLIKFIVGPTIHVREGSIHLWYSGNT